MEIHEVSSLFKKEFQSVYDKFKIIELNLDESAGNDNDYVGHPGVYVFWHPKHKVVRVGRSLSNTHKRAMQHIRDNTKNDEISFRELAMDQQTKLLLFNLKNRKDYHWAATLEIFFEDILKPAIKPKRRG